MLRCFKPRARLLHSSPRDFPGFAFAFYMDRQKEERERGVTIACTTKEFYTEKWHYTTADTKH